ncbi:MAG: NAD-dependent epimerase/dehydratase family protein [Armatimonadetes bacterium]|nr:NAD-dependent epimerase/dehydratase family protein [Armatimonadota bacterium]
MQILVIGGTQFFGKQIVRQFLERSDRVSVYSRGRRHPEFLSDVEHIQGDRTDHAAFIAALQGRSFDVVIDNIAFVGADVKAAVDAFAGRVGRYILTTTGSVYGARRLEAARQLRLIKEEDADLALREGEPYGDGKRACEQVLHERAGRARGLPFVIIRPPVVQGPEDPTGRVWFYVQRIADGGPVLLPAGFPASATRHVYSADLARAYVLAATSPAAADRTYNVAMDEIVTQADYVWLLGLALDREVEIVEVPRGGLARDEPLSSYRPPFSWRFVPDIQRVQHDLEWRSTPVLDWLRITAAWLLEHPQPDSEGYASRDAERRAADRWRR